jgi:hypothetical protein
MLNVAIRSIMECHYGECCYIECYSNVCHYFVVRWLSVDGHVVDCHLRRASLCSYYVAPKMTCIYLESS